ncbi:MAG: hypothetical protein KAT96_00095 [Candidatus Omnitrophica bacterium]|nr:hypothetical protein [Candidatus Omnitrophota bacterium]
MKKYASLFWPIILILSLISGCEKKKQDNENLIQGKTRSIEQMPPAAEEVNSKQELAKEDLSLLKYGRDNPFKQAFDKPVRAKKGMLVLEGIVLNKGHPIAIINDEIVGVGDKINGNTIVSINRNSVTLSNGTILLLGSGL